MKKYPLGTKNAIKLNKLIQIEEKMLRSDLPSSRVVKCASVLPKGELIGWQMFVPSKGLVDISFFGGSSVSKADLTWITETVARSVSDKADRDESKNSLNRLYMLSLEVDVEKPHMHIGFCDTTSSAESHTISSCSSCSSWPITFSQQFPELIRILRSRGAFIRYCTYRPEACEVEDCAMLLKRTWTDRSIMLETYMGKPVKVSILIRLSEEPTIRMKTVFDEAIPGVTISYIGTMEEEKCQMIWNDPSLVGKTYPEIASKILMMEPMLLSSDPVVGIRKCEKEAPVIPATHENPTEKNALTVGKALHASGIARKVKIDDTALKMHWDIVGMSGTGKSSLLIQTVLSALRTNHSCTVIDPHGSLVDSILRCVPAEYAPQIQVIRIGDGDKNPVPIQIHKTNDIEQEEVAINNICTMFQEIFDPKSQGFIGPRWIRIYSLLSKCSIALGFGGTFQSILTFAQSKDNLRLALDALRDSKNEKYRDIYEGIRTELLNNRSNDYEEVISWFVAKFQRLVAVPQLRNIFGTTGTADVLDFSSLIEGKNVTLIDLSSPIIGTDASRISGILILNQLWDAILGRADRSKNHLLIVDEAHLFSGAGSRLDRIIYEGRKFGISLIMAHQNCTQLSADIREALASTANFSSFRLSVRDASEAASRFDNDSFRTKLCRLSNFNAVTTFSIDGRQSEPFTLQIMKPQYQRDCEQIAASIEKKSIEILVNPYRHIKAYTSQDILKKMKTPDLPIPATDEFVPEEEVNMFYDEQDSGFLSKWLEMKNKFSNVA